MKSFEEFIKEVDGTSFDYDKVSQIQCIDLIKKYLAECFEIKVPNGFGNAVDYYTGFEKKKLLYENFIKIKNTPEFIPDKGDIFVWNEKRGKGAGHVAICTGEGTTSYFYSYDLNWNGRKKVQKVKHDYKNVYGVLRYNKEEKPKEEPKQKEFEAGMKVLVPIKFTGSESACNELVECETYAGARQFWVANEEFKKDYIEGIIAFVEGDSLGVAFHYYNFTNGIKTEFQIRVKKEGCK